VSCIKLNRSANFLGPQFLRPCVSALFARGENSRIRSVNTKTIFVFIFSSEIRSKTVTLETKVRYEHYTGYDRNLKYDR
jgi:hypothetical protein